MDTTSLSFYANVVYKIAPTASLEYRALRDWEPYGFAVKAHVGFEEDLSPYQDYKVILNHKSRTYGMEMVSNFGTTSKDFDDVCSLLSSIHRVPLQDYYVPFATNMALRLNWFFEDNDPTHHKHGQYAHDYLLSVNDTLPQVTCHGDFQGKNIYRDNTQLKVIDPIPTTANAYFDLAMWLVTTEGAPALIREAKRHGYNPAVLAPICHALAVLNHNPNRPSTGFFAGFQGLIPL